MRRGQPIYVTDPLYGEIQFSPTIGTLIRSPAVQRLRQIRLSNIDSISMPGIANVSRYEHALGAAHLATQLGLFGKLHDDEAIVLEAAALLHDVAISAFGHLVEEAFKYVRLPFNHEEKMARLLSGAERELGDIELQVFLGRESGIRRWAEQIFGSKAERFLHDVAEALHGRGRLGVCIAGDVDVDNLDNLVRIAFHMGLDVERRLPVDIAARIVDATDGVLTVSDGAIELVNRWLALRHGVYTKLMLSRYDFAGKIMLLSATVRAYEAGMFDPPEYAWTLTDRDLIEKLLHSADERVRDTVESWMLARPWPLSELIWLREPAPAFSKLHQFNRVISDHLARPCFAYRIVDKRARMLSLRTVDGGTTLLGKEADTWVLGVASSKRETFTIRDNVVVRECAAEFFKTACLGSAESDARDESLF